MFIDTHCHLNFKAFDADVDHVIQRAVDAGIEKIIIPGAKLDSSQKAVEIAGQYPGCFAAVGIHPHHARETCHPELVSGSSAVPKEMLNQVQHDKITSELTNFAKNSKVAAIGEIGIDYYQYKNAPSITDDTKKLQKELFLLQLRIAQTCHLPVIIHGREAHDGLLEILKSFMTESGTNVFGVFHCFGGNQKHLKDVLDLGFYVGFDGNITYKDSNSLRELVALTPLDRLLLETDAPYLTPIPHRGTRNEPSYLPYIAKTVASIHQKGIEEIAQITSNNAIKLFHV